MWYGSVNGKHLCDTHTHTHTHNTHTHHNFFSISYSLTDFDASHNQITYVPSGLFQMTELTNVQLSYNLLNYLPGDPEDSSAQTSTGIYVHYNTTLVTTILSMISL